MGFGPALISGVAADPAPSGISRAGAGASIAVVRSLVLSLCLCSAAMAGDATAPAPIPAPLPTGEALDQGDPPAPGRDLPAGPPPLVARRFDWDDYRTVVVVDDGVGVTRPAWVGTWEKATGKWQVAYRAVAFRDARGRLHVDARKSQCVGPRSRGWSPDSFAFGLARMWTVDDRDSAHEAAGGEIIPADTQAALYRSLLSQVQALVEGGS